VQAAGTGGSGEAAAEGGEDSGGDSSSESGSGAGSGAGILKKEEEDDPLGVAREVVPAPRPGAPRQRVRAPAPCIRSHHLFAKSDQYGVRDAACPISTG